MSTQFQAPAMSTTGQINPPTGFSTFDMTSSQRKSFNTAGKKVFAGISKDAKFGSDLLKTNVDIASRSL